MLEAYAFLAAFSVQVLVMTVLIPAWSSRHFRLKVARSAEHLAQLYPGVDVSHALERYLAQHRVLTSGLTLLGLLLVGWLFSDAWRANWNADKAGLLSLGYYVIAVALPTIQLVRSLARFNKEHKPAVGKRTALLQRRGLFDFVSPFTIFVAVLCYLLFVAFTIYIEHHPFPGFGGALANVGILTLGYVGLGFGVYHLLYGKNRSPFDTNLGHLQKIGLSVKSAVYVCIATTVNATITLALSLLDLKSWGPFAGSIFFTTLTLLFCMGFSMPLRDPEKAVPNYAGR
jgi:MFS family permease